MIYVRLSFIFLLVAAVAMMVGCAKEPTASSMSAADVQTIVDKTVKDALAKYRPPQQTEMRVQRLLLTRPDGTLAGRLECDASGASLALIHGDKSAGLSATESYASVTVLAGEESKSLLMAKADMSGLSVDHGKLSSIVGAPGNGSIGMMIQESSKPRLFIGHGTQGPAAFMMGADGEVLWRSP